MLSQRNDSSSSIAEVAAWMLAFLFCYTAISKLYDWQGTKLAMYNQVIPDGMKDSLLYGIPIVELITVVFLLVPKLRTIGFQMSAFLMLAFTCYVAWIWMGWAGRVPCSCGGVISSLGWGEHLVFNLVFLAISFVGTKLNGGLKGLKNL